MQNDVKNAEAAEPENSGAAAPVEAEKPAEEKTSAPAETEKSAEGESAAPAEAEKSAETEESAEEEPAAAKKKSRRRRIVKRILIGVGITFGVLLLLLTTALIFRDPIIKFVIGKVGPSLLGVKVEVESIETSLFKGTVRLRKLAVGNPKGYNADNAVELGELFVKINIRSLFTKKIEVEEIVVDGLKIGVEVAGQGINLMDIYEYYKMKSAKKKKKKKKEKEPGPQVVIRRLLIKDSSLNVSVWVGQAQVPPMHIPLDREMKDIGENGDKDAWKELKKEFSGYYDKIVNFVNVNGIGDTLKSGIDGLKNLF